MALAASLVTCRFDKLINPAIRDRLVVSPDSVRGSAHAGSGVEDTVTLRIASADGATLSWTARTTSPWLSLSPSSGGAPDSLVVTLDPELLAQNLHQGTILFTSPQAPDTVRIPVSFNILPPAPELRLSDTAHADTAFARSALPDTFTLWIENTGALPLTWNAALDTGWVVVSDSAGSVPAQDSIALLVTLRPESLTAGAHRGTITVTAPGAIGSPAAVSITFTIQPCAETPVTPDVVAAGSITLSDCGAPQRPGSLARLYSVTSTVGDTLSFRLTSPNFDAYLVLTDGLGASLDQNDNCPPLTGPACLLNFRVPAAGRYVIEATTAAPGATGAFSLSVVREQAPTAPQSIRQFRGDSATAIGTGLTTPDNVAVFRGTVSDPNAQDSMRLEIEVVETSSPFSGTANHQSGFVGVGDTAWIRVSGLTENAGYHWRARTCDRTQRCSAWLNFGGNAEGAADFLVNAIPENPALNVVSLNQFNGAFAIAVGGGTGGGLNSTQTVTFRAVVTDADPGDVIVLEVESKATNAAFDGTSDLYRGTGVTSASTASAAAGYTVGLLTANYHWRARACDQTARCSGWQPFGGNSDDVAVLNPADTDFHVP